MCAYSPEITVYSQPADRAEAQCFSCLLRVNDTFRRFRKNLRYLFSNSTFFISFLVFLWQLILAFLVVGPSLRRPLPSVSSSSLPAAPTRHTPADASRGPRRTPSWTDAHAERESASITSWSELTTRAAVAMATRFALDSFPSFLHNERDTILGPRRTRVEGVR